ncbi:MAG: YqgE/AlgH family protein [Candidatus Dormiibacterota bacterium]
MTGDDLRGKLLVAQPALRDPNFDRAVVLVLDHGDDGAIGLVLNRPSLTRLVEAWPEWGDYAAQPPVVFVGGPVVEEGAAICLSRARSDDATDAWKPVVSGIGTLDVSRAPGEVGTDIEEVRVFAGYAGWTAGQLEAEIAAGGWFVVDAKPVDSFTSDPEGLWRAVLGRQQGMMAWFANFPPDIRLN